MRITSLAIGLAAALCASPALAHTIVVGSCVPGANSLPTIGAAISAIGTNGVIKICPGVYPEQLSINKSLTLEGLSAGNSAYPTIVVPAGGLVANATDPDQPTLPTGAQILVTGGATVAISKLTVDGSNNNIQTCDFDMVGILYQNASGSIKSSAVVNQVMPPATDGCQGGLGIYVESSTGTSTVTISGNVVQNFDKNGITADDTGTNVTVTGNTVIGQGSWSGAAQNSIQIAFGATAKITSNIVGDDIWGPDVLGDTGNAATGVLIYDSAGVQVAGNTISSTQGAIAVVYDGTAGYSADGASITGNMITATYFYDGVDLCGAGGATVARNSINGSANSAIHLDSSCGTPSTGNTVAGNKISFACAGILVGSGSDTPGGANTILNAQSLILTGSDVCPIPAFTPAQAGYAGRSHARHYHPFGR